MIPDQDHHGLGDTHSATGSGRASSAHRERAGAGRFRQGQVGRGWLARGSHQRLSHRGVRGAIASRAVVFLVLQQGLFGVYMGASFAQPQRHARCGPGREGRFPGRQALTSHNIRGSLLTDLALGGLTTRLSITCSRPCRGRVCVTPTRPCGGSAPSTAFLHTQTGLLVSYAQVLRHLHTTDRTAGPEPAADTAAADPDAGP